jgi:hypothetical protein
MTPKQTTDERIAVRRAHLTKQRAERQDEQDLPRTMTMRQVRDYLAETARIDAEIAAFETAVATLAAVPPIEPDTRFLADAIACRATCSAERLAIKSPIRDRALMERAQGLEWSVRLIDYGLGISSIGQILTLASTRVGELLAAAGYTIDGPGLRGPNGFRGSLPEVEARIKALTKQRTAAQAALDVLLRTDEEKAQQDATDTAFRQALATMDLKLGIDGRSLDAFTKDGHPLPVADMTEIQRKAFERFEQAHAATV